MNDALEQTLESLSGFIERVVLHNLENGYCVLRINAKGHRHPITLVGHANAIAVGEFIQASGTWVNDRTYGTQFKADYLKITPPSTLEGIKKYLSSGMVKGVGPVYAKKLIQAFGENVFDVIEKEPEKLKSVAGIGAYRTAMIIKSWSGQKAVRDIMLFLHQHGISTARAVRIYKVFGGEAIKVITENPYRLAREIKGIGFASADIIAQRVGIAKDSLLRAQAGLHFTLLKAMDDGHCGLPLKELLRQAQHILDISQDILEQALKCENETGEIVYDRLGEDDGVFLKGLYQAEQAIARLLCLQGKGNPPWKDINSDKAIPWVEEKLNISLAQSQKAAIVAALSSKVMVITGGPGVGKTTLVNSILTILRSKSIQVMLCAPTGRAARRLSESTGLEAKTIHRLLEFDPYAVRFKRGADYPLECHLLVIDEVSMVDVPLMHALLKAVPTHAAVILVGDVDQLPSVGPGQVLRDIIAANCCPVVSLTEVFRQAALSHIITNAHLINQGLLPHLPEKRELSDFYFIEAEKDEECVHKIIEIVHKRIPHRFGLDPLHDIQLLCPMNRGGVGAHSLNIELQKVLNENTLSKVERFGWTYSQGDKVMQTTNNYDKEIFNGDIGYIKEINTDAEELVICYDLREVLYSFGEFDEIMPAYAITIHKSQGSEYPAVVIPLMTQHYVMLKRNLLYTGVTRGKRLVVLVGQKKALEMAVKEHVTNGRWSKLKDCLISIQNTNLSLN